MARVTTLTEFFRAPNPEESITLEEVTDHGSTFHRLLLDLFEHADGAHLTKSVNQRPWLKDFSGVNDFNDSLRSYHEDANEMTMALISHFETYASTILFVIWQQNFSEHLESFQNQPDLNRPLNGEDIYRPAGAFIAALRELKNNGSWRYLCERVRKFSLLAGCPKTFPNPFDTIDALRATTIRNSSDSLEARLLAEIEQLRKQNKEYEERHRVQSRIISNLSYRFLLERLPGPTPKNVSNTAHWQAFWSQALHNASGSTNHPLAVLLERFGNDKRMVSQIQKVGEGMYGTMSTNIHHFRGVYNVDPSQWDELPGAILQALSPMNFNADGSIDWSLERARY